MNTCQKFLIMRFSSFGDIVACLSLPAAIKKQYPDAEIHWVTRNDYAETAKSSNFVKKVWSLNRKKGLSELIQISKELRKENFDFIYDAHNNTRSNLITWLLLGPMNLFRFLNGKKFIRRSQYRWRRFLLFYFRINLYPKPCTLQFALLEPLFRWGISTELPPPPLLSLTKELLNQVQDKIKIKSLPVNQRKIALSPSASYELKRWPIEYWKKLILENSQDYFFLLGGPEDQFIEDIRSVAPDRSLNLAGKLNYLESSAVIQLCDAVVSNDTGLMHVAEQLGKPCIALMGPAPFGFPARPLTKILEIDLPCRPCSKHGQGPCINPTYQKCLVDILPQTVSKELSLL